MQTSSADYKTAIASPDRQIKGYLKFNGSFVLSGEDGLISFKTTQNAMDAERFCVGSVTSAFCEANFYNEGLEGSGVSLANSYFDAYIGVVTDPDNNTVEYVCCGRYYVSEVTRSTATTRILGYDIAGRLSMDYVPTVTAGSSGYLVMDILNDIIDQTGVNGGDHFTTFGDDVYVPQLFEGNCRAQWGWLCSLVAENASSYSGTREPADLGYIKEFVAGNGVATPYAVDETTTYMDGLSLGDEYTITSFTSGTTDDPIVIGNGTGLYGLNPYMTTAVATAIETSMDGYAYYPTTLRWRGDPCLDILDEINVTKGEDTFKVVAMKIETTFNGGLEQTITCYGDSEEYYAMSTSPTQGQINRVSNLVQEIQQAIETADGGVITKILDTDGTWKELVIANNQDLSQATSVWRFNINGLMHSNRYSGGTYTLAMDTQGRIVANVIQTGTLQDAAGKNSWNLDTGAFTITNGSLNITTASETDDLIQLNAIVNYSGASGTISTIMQPTEFRLERDVTYQGGNRTVGIASLVSPASNPHLYVAKKTYNSGGTLLGTDSALLDQEHLTLCTSAGSSTLSAWAGLTFYNPSGTKIGEYPSTGLPMLSAATAVNADAITGKVINLGELSRTDLGLSSTSATETEVITAFLTYICSHYTSAVSCIFEAVIVPNSKRMMRCFVYDTSVVSGGLPQYATGTMLYYNGTPYIFGTSSYSVFVHKTQDYVVEEGDSGQWAYRKWASGRYECWTRRTITLAIDSAWGQVYYKGITALNYPVTFTQSPYEFVNADGGDGYFWVGGNGRPTTTQTGTYSLFRPVTTSSATYYIDYYVRGMVSS